MPWWTGVLEAAEAWGVPPWEVVGSDGDSRFLWYTRWKAYSDAVNQAAAEKRDKAKRRRAGSD